MTIAVTTTAVMKTRKKTHYYSCYENYGVYNVHDNSFIYMDLDNHLCSIPLTNTIVFLSPIQSCLYKHSDNEPSIVNVAVDVPGSS